jgi:imidazolonepropionase-like amidohydrolase
MAISPIGGHGDLSDGLDPDFSHPHWEDALVDSPAEGRKAVRLLHKNGADLIKIMPSGGVLSIGDNPEEQLMDDDEIAAVVQAAHALGMKVAAHAHGKKAIDSAVRLGVDSIEHGSYADAQSYALMKAHGTYLVPTLLVAAMVSELARTHPEQLPPFSAAKALQVAPHTLQNLHAAYSAGVKIAFGTRYGFSASWDQCS